MGIIQCMWTLLLRMTRKWESQWRSACLWCKRIQGSIPVKVKNFWVRQRCPITWGLWCSSPSNEPINQGSVLVHIQIKARTILQSLCVSYKTVETFGDLYSAYLAHLGNSRRNGITSAANVLRRENEHDALTAALPIIPGWDTFWDQARLSAKHLKHWTTVESVLTVICL
jgi:hypothetical protein